MDPTILTFQVQSSELEALVHADRASKAALSSIDDPERWKVALALLDSSSIWINDLNRVFRRRAAQFISMLNERANQTLPVSRLHPDVLGMIFEHVADAHLQEHTLRREQWIRVGHVCRGWRNVLLDAAHLWARDIFAFGVKRGLEEILPLTRNAPLDLVPPRRSRGFTSPTAHHDFVSSILPLVGRARVLHVSIASHADLALLTDALSTDPIPDLKELVIKWKNTAGNTVHANTRINLADHQKLTVLRTYGYLARPHVGNNILSADINLGAYLASNLPTEEALLDILASMGQLRYLALRKWRSLTHHRAPTRLIKHQLLQTLIVENPDTESFLHLMRQLHLPTLVQATFDLVGHPTFGHHHDVGTMDSTIVRSALEYLDDAIAGSPATLQRKCVYIRHATSHMNASAASLSVRWSALYMPETRFLDQETKALAPEVHIRFPTRLTDELGVAEIVSRHLASSSAIHQTIHLDWKEGLPATQGMEYWVAALAPFKYIQSVQLDNTYYSLRGPLVALAESESNNASGPLLGSARRLCWTARENWGCLNAEFFQGENALLTNFIRVRASRGAPIEALELRLMDAYTIGNAVPPLHQEESDVSRTPGKAAILQLAGEVGARATFVHVEVDDLDGVYPIRKIYDYTDVLLAYETATAQSE
ncbi:hypothetical protein PENSPDRAFT_653340 [Peniophora sp. CONT]|nr:hypothetical protein PENSPDRAFT_653340 [Peniophora sp. CONT]